MPKERTTIKQREEGKNAVEQQEEEEEINNNNNLSEFHPIACQNCREAHKKCDKTLPSCLSCLKKGISCCYKTPKRTRKAKTNNNENETQKHLTKRNVIDIYYSVICEGCPCIERQELENYIFPTNDNLPNRKEIETLFYSIQSLCEQRLGLLEVAEESSKKAKKGLSKRFDQIENYYIAATFTMLAIYEFGNNNINLSRYYLNATNFYFELKEGKELNKYESGLKTTITLFKITHLTSVGITDDSLMQQSAKGLTEVFNCVTGKTIHPQVLEVLFKTIAQLDESNVKSFVESIDLFGQEVHKIMLEKIKESRTKDVFEGIDHLMHNLISNSWKIIAFSQVGTENDLIEESAAKITELTENELFPYLSFAVIPFIMISSKIHLKLCKIAIVENNGPKLCKFSGLDYFELLKKDLRAINIFANKFKRVYVVYGPIIKEMEEVLLLKQSLNDKIVKEATTSTTSITTAMTTAFLGNDNLVEFITLMHEFLEMQFINEQLTTTLSFLLLILLLTHHCGLTVVGLTVVDNQNNKQQQDNINVFNSPLALRNYHQIENIEEIALKQVEIRSLLCFKVYGNYCGAGWCGGNFIGNCTSNDEQLSIDNNNANCTYEAQPIDDLDACCKAHDSCCGVESEQCECAPAISTCAKQAYKKCDSLWCKLAAKAIYYVFKIRTKCCYGSKFPLFNPQDYDNDNDDDFK
ncbi:hypothetical protein ABK040_008020 [Willaertia magna]